MSRGGRGRGRGGGPGAGGGANGPSRDAFNAAFGGLSKDEGREILQSFTRPTKGSGMLYPPLEDESLYAFLPGPSKFEERVIQHQLSLNRDLADGPLDKDTLRRTGAPWRLANERKVVVVQIESYSDRFASQPSASGPSKIDADVLKLNKSMFPPSLWEAYFESADGGVGRRRTKLARPKRPREDDEEDDGEEEPERERSGSPGSDDENDDFDFEEDEDDHQDYDANYFDNGEGDDDDEPQDENEDGGVFNDD